MKELNFRFLEEYKRLDSILCDIYGTNSGVTAYIDDMKSVGSRGESVEKFNQTLKTLVRLRKIRNELSHEVGTLDSDICSQSDISQLIKFTNLLLEKCDPLAVFYSQNSADSAKEKHRGVANKAENAPNKAGELSKAAVIIIAVTAAAFLTAVIVPLIQKLL